MNRRTDEYEGKMSIKGSVKGNAEHRSFQPGFKGV